ncbi:Ribosomal RNA-processing protein 7 [Serendipita sp. 407]|nr:Ribosomal RNA-processing protein 7 [Serendipita sp. 407]
MEVFEYKQAQESKANSKYRKGEAIVDEDGFTLVTRGGAYGQTLGGGVGVASKKFMQEVAKGGGKRNRKKKDTNKAGLYAFQIREKRIKEQVELKRSFDADKRKFEHERKKKRFNPY